MPQPVLADKQLAKGRLVLSVAMFAMGGCVATWASRLPTFQQHFHASPGILSLSLLSGAVGAVAARQLAAYLCNKFGTGPVTVYATILYAGLMALMPFCPSYTWFCICFFSLGTLGGIMGVALNAHAVLLERLHGSPIMSGLHGFFSTGCMVGALLSSLLTNMNVPPEIHFTAVAAAFISVMLVLRNAVLPADLDRQSTDKHATPVAAAVQPSQGPASSPLAATCSFLSTAKVIQSYLSQHRTLLAFCAMTLCSYMAEGAIGDWTAIYMRSVMHSSDGVAALGFAVFNVAMCLGRFTGDAVTAKLGSVATVRLGGILAMCGLAVELSSSQPLVAMAGLVAAGLGFANVVPNIFSTCGKSSDNAAKSIATVAIAGNVGSLLGPPAIGFTAELFGLKCGLALTCLASLVIALLASNLRVAAADRSRVLCTAVSD